MSAFQSRDGVPLEGELRAENSVGEILLSLTNWSNSVKFVSYEMAVGRPTHDPQWLHDVGVRMDRAVDLLRKKLKT